MIHQFFDWNIEKNEKKKINCRNLARQTYNEYKSDLHWFNYAKFNAGMYKYSIRSINVLRIKFECSNLIMSINTLISNFSFYISDIPPIWYLSIDTSSFICLNINKSVWCVHELTYESIRWKCYNKMNKKIGVLRKNGQL